MHKQNPTPPSERRAHVRYPHSLRSSCRLLGREAGASWTATVEDVSPSGTALVMSCEVKRGAVLVVALEGLGGRFARPLLVRVLHAQARADGHWQVGCAFVKPLTDNDIQALLLVAPAGRKAHESA